MNKSIILQAKALSAIVLLNFAAQVPYFLHLYLGRQPWLTSLRSFAVMGLVFAFFLTAAILLFKGRREGYLLMVAFLATEFLFYLFGSVSSALHGFGLFFQVRNPDVVLRVIYSVGYLNLFASGYFLLLLVSRRRAFRTS